MTAILELLHIKPRAFDEYCPKCGMGHNGGCYETPKQKVQEYQTLTCASGPEYWEDDSAEKTSV